MRISDWSSDVCSSDLSGTAREASAYLHNQPHNHQRQSGTASMAKLFIGGLVFDGIAKPVSGQGVLVEEGRVAAVAPAAEFAGFTGETVDTSGGTLMPGLIDCHVHLTLGGEGDQIGRAH